MLPPNIAGDGGRERRHDAVAMVTGMISGPVRGAADARSRSAPRRPARRARHRDGGADARRAARPVRQRLRAHRGRPARADVHRLDRHPHPLAGASALHAGRHAALRHPGERQRQPRAAHHADCSTTWTSWTDEMDVRGSRLVLVSSARIPLLQADADIGRYLTARSAPRPSAHRPVVTFETGHVDIRALLDRNACFGALVVAACSSRTCASASSRHADLGPATSSPRAPLPRRCCWSTSGCRAVSTTRLAMLGKDVLVGAHRWPRLVAGLHARNGRADRACRGAARDLPAATRRGSAPRPVLSCSPSSGAA